MKINSNTRIIDLTLGELLEAVENRVKDVIAGKPDKEATAEKKLRLRP